MNSRAVGYSPLDETGDVTDDGQDEGNSYAGTEEEILETNIEAVKDCARPLIGQKASDLTVFTGSILVPVPMTLAEIDEINAAGERVSNVWGKFAATAAMISIALCMPMTGLLGQCAPPEAV